MRATIAVFNKKGNSALPTVIGVLKNHMAAQSLNFTVCSSKKVVSHKSPDILSKQNIDSSIVIGCSFTKEAKKAYSFHQTENTTVVFEGSLYTSLAKEALIQEAFKDFLHHETQLYSLIEKVDGDYSFFVLKNEQISAVRDPIGVQPLYYGENNEMAAFASNRKVLWQIGIEKVVSFPPGNLCLLTKAGFQFKPVRTVTYVEPKQVFMDEATLEVQRFLEQTVKARVVGLKEVAVAFSGGLDSSIIAYMASKCGVGVNLIHVSLENGSEIETAFESAEKLNLPMQVHLFKETDVEKALPCVVNLIEEADPVKVAIGMSMYWVAQRAQEAGYAVLLAGQGADELFGGYQRYVKEGYENGVEKVHQTMFNDLKGIHENNLERDVKICIDSDVGLRLPFVSFNLIEYALGLPVNLKFEQKQDTLRKLVLRNVALNLGLSATIVNKPKKAVQYSTGINSAIKRIAQKNNQTVNEYITKLFQRTHQTN